MSKKKEIFKQIGIYSGSTQLAQLITLVAAILSRRFLGPLQTGIWSVLQIIVDYSKYSTMGTMEVVTREIPYLIGKGEPAKAEKIKNIAFSFILSTSIFIAVCIALFSFLCRNFFSQEITYGLLSVSVLIVLQRINNLLISLLRCYKKFEVEAGLMIVSAMVNAVLVAFLTYCFKIYGFIWAMILSFLFNIIYILWRFNFHFGWEYNGSELKKIMSYGLPLMIIGVLMLGIRSADKIVIVKMAGFEVLGLYSIALMACSYVSNFSVSIAIVFLPHLQERIALHKNIQELEGYLHKSSLTYVAIMPVLIGLVWIFAPVAIHFVLPKFILGIEAMKILSLSTFFVALTQPYQDLLIGLKKHMFLFPVLSFVLVLSFAVDYWVIHAGFGIMGVAAATSLIVLFNFSVIYFLATQQYTDFRKAAIKYVHFVSFAVYFFFIFYALDRWATRSGNLVQTILFQTVIFIISYIPVLVILNRELSIFTMLRQKISGLSTKVS